MAQFNCVTIVGLGLIGGSLGMAVRRRRLARKVIGLSRSPATLRRAKQYRAIDLGTTDVKRAVQDADLVVIATPVDTIVSCAVRLARLMRPGSVLTDVGSTKASIVNTLDRKLPSRVAFVGAHPIAGFEQRGIDAANPRLFDGSLCVLTPTARTDRRALRCVSRFWKPLVDEVLTMSPAQHDRVLAGVSHLPHLLAYCLVEGVEIAPLSRAPRSFLDMTRVAKSSPELWDAIFLSNRTALLAAMNRFDHRWRTLRAHLARGDRAALRRLLSSAQSTRNALQDC